MGDLVDAFGGVPGPEIEPRYNVAPTQQVLTLRAQPAVGLAWASMRWGLIPSWSPEPTTKYATFNAVGETITEKRSYADSFRSMRCLVPVTGFFEWKKPDKTPYRITTKSGEPFALAAVYSRWHKDQGKGIESCSIVTTTPNEVMKPLHNRMPVILSPADYDCWLDPRNNDTDSLQELLRPCDDDLLYAYEVDRIVSNARNDVPECLEPAA